MYIKAKKKSCFSKIKKEIRVLDKIMKLINNNSKDMRGIIDEDLKSELITYSVELIRNKKIYKKFKN